MNKILEFKENLCKDFFAFLKENGYTENKYGHIIEIEFPMNDRISVCYNAYDMYDDETFADEIKAEYAVIYNDDIRIGEEYKEAYASNITCEELYNFIEKAKAYLKNNK